MTISPAVVYVS